MDIKVSNTSIETASADAILVGQFEGAEISSGAVDKALNGAISELIRVFLRASRQRPKMILAKGLHIV